jgi:hypothetical protein
MSKNFCYVGHGSHEGKPGGCVMEWVSMIFTKQVRIIRLGGGWGNALVDPVYSKWIEPRGGWQKALKSDHPVCTALHITDVAIRINDRCNDRQRARLALHIPRLIRATFPRDHEKYAAVLQHLVEMFDIDLEKHRCPTISGVRPPTCQCSDALSRLVLKCAEVVDGKLLGPRPTREAMRKPPADKAVDEALDWLDHLLDMLDKAKAEEGCLADEDYEYPSDEEVAEIVEMLANASEAQEPSQRIWWDPAVSGA